MHWTRGTRRRSAGDREIESEEKDDAPNANEGGNENSSDESSWSERSQTSDSSVEETDESIWSFSLEDARLPDAGQVLLELFTSALPGRRRSRELTAQDLRPENNMHPFEHEQRESLKKSDYSQRVRVSEGHCGNLLNGKRTGQSNASLLQALFRRSLIGAFPSMDRVNLGQRRLPATSQRHTRLMQSERSRVYSGQFSGAGNIFVAACQDERICVYRVPDWKLHKTIIARDVNWTVTSVDITPDEGFIAYSSITPVIHLCNLGGSYEMHEKLEVGNGRHRMGIWCTRFAPGGGEMACGTSSHELALYDIERETTSAMLAAHDDDINTVEYVDKQNKPYLIATGSDDTLIKIWDRRLIRESRRGRRNPGLSGILAGHCEGLTHISSRGDGVYIVSNSKDQTAKLWDIRKMHMPRNDGSLKLPPRRFKWDYRWCNYPGWGVLYKHPLDVSLMTYRGHIVLNTLIRCYFSPQHTTGQRFIYTGSQCGSVFIYDSLTGKIVKRLRGHRSLVRDVGWHPYLPLLCSSSWDGSVAVWSV